MSLSVRVAGFSVIEAGHVEGREVFALSFGRSPLAATDVEVESVTGGVVIVEVGVSDGHEVPFSKKGGGVSGFFECFGKKDAFVIDARFPLGHGELGEGSFMAGDPVGELESGGIASAENGSAAGRTHGAGGVAIGEEHAVGGELVDVRSLVKLRAVASEVAKAEVIDKEKDKVGLRVFGQEQAWQDEREKEKRFHEEWLERKKESDVFTWTLF